RQGRGARGRGRGLTRAPDAAARTLASMTSPDLEQIHAALATVNDPEIRRPITDLGMVESVEAGADGLVRVKVLLTVAGCPLKDTITRDVNAAVGKVAGVTGVDLT